MSIDIAEFIDAEVERSIREELARERQAQRRALACQRWLEPALARPAAKDARD